MITGKRYDKLHFSRQNIFKSITLSTNDILPKLFIKFRYAGILKNIYMKNIVCYILNIRNAVSFSAKLHEFAICCWKVHIFGSNIFFSNHVTLKYALVIAKQHQTTTKSGNQRNCTCYMYCSPVISIQQWFLTLTPLDFSRSLMSTERYLTAILEIPVVRPRF